MTSSIGMSELGRATSPNVAMMAVSAEQERDARRHERSEDDDQDDQGHRDREQTSLLEVVHEGGIDLLVGADAERADEHLRVRRLSVLDRGDDRVDLRRRVVGIAGDVEVNERGAPALPDLTGVLGSSGDRMFVTTSSAETLATTSSTAAAKAGSLMVSESLWTRTLSPAGWSNSSWRSLSTRPDSPTPDVACSILVVPLRMPAANATTTNASQPKMAVFRCCALQRPIRPARLVGFLGSSGGGALGSEADRSSGSFWMTGVFIAAPLWRRSRGV